ncbi:MAG: flagellar basal body L-ring protein FlgH [Gammaproteobacteria bacterium]|nr:flagellar basal body L-ring protein FlgH [Gammaproteobacteria bacterium]
MTNSSKILLLLIAVLLQSACVATRAPQEPYQPNLIVPQLLREAPPGTIYTAGSEIRLWEDRKAARVGDILTVRLYEKTNATKNSQTTTGKSSDVALANPAIFGAPVTHNGVSLLDGSLSGTTDFDGKGASSQSNSLSGDITVTVLERMPNGNLRIGGEKWVTLNQGQEFIRLSGVIRPDDIEPDNSLLSTRIADAQITYSSKGVLAAANKMGLISRFFNSVFYPY